ncbi:TadE/TadG family type IV pilus assembly protein [Ruegeria atlantica]|uniref:TadE/TadG family type IV pilus assembly protein n=1 Tax=Ruegeria atlantica TaxID=81569 RepID=UPI001480F1FB|nr:TadE/TadG family type IV pilus assembly protein [Ruegeria atlantica]
MIKRAIRGGVGVFRQKTPFARRFAKDEDGAVFTLFVLLGFIVILATTGIGVDMMNHERDRASLQAALDRAVLAAADLEQELPPAQVVADYLEKSNVRGSLVADPVVEIGLGSRRVTAEALVVVPTHFMRFSGVDTLNAIATSSAEESVESVEISMILDMSGSMRWPSAEDGKTKIQVLRDAAKRFVTLMYEQNDASDVSISIVPYATQVNAGAAILDQFPNVSSEHHYSHCVNFPASQFSKAALSPDDTLDRTAHFDIWSVSRNPIRFPVCPTRAGSEITAVTDNVAQLQDAIDALTPDGNTSIDTGVKWGAALLDPQFRPIIETLATDDTVPADKVVPAKFKERPLNYDGDVLKVMIVMTDGQNTEQFRLRDRYRSGNSGVWYNPDFNSTGEFSALRSTDPDEFSWTFQNTDGNSHPYGELRSEPGTATQLTFPELFNLTSLRWNARFNYDLPRDRENQWVSSTYNTIDRSVKNERTQSICSAVKDSGVVVFGIAFEAPVVGLETIRGCASTPQSHVYAVNSDGSLGGNNLSLEEAFESIAASIKTLRLTQ